MQIVSIGDNLQELSKPIFWAHIRKKNVILSFAELAHRVVKVKIIQLQ